MRGVCPSIPERDVGNQRGQKWEEWNEDETSRFQLWAVAARVHLRNAVEIAEPEGNSEERILPLAPCRDLQVPS